MNNFQESVRRKHRLLIFTVVLTTILVIESAVFIIAATRPEGKYFRSLNLGNRYLQSLEYDEAVKAFTKAINIDPKKADAYIGRGDAYAGLNQNELACDDYAYAITIDSYYESELLPKIEELSLHETETVPEPATITEPTSPPEPTDVPEPTSPPEPTQAPTPTVPPALYVPPVYGTDGVDYGGRYLGTSGEEYSFNLYTSNDDPKNPGVVYIPDYAGEDTAYEMWEVETDVYRLDQHTGERTLYAVFDTRDGEPICTVYENGELLDECIRIRRPMAG